MFRTFFALVAFLALASTAFADFARTQQITLQPGSMVTIMPFSETTVWCAGSANPNPVTVISRSCACIPKDPNSSWTQNELVLIVTLSDGNIQKTSLGTYSFDNSCKQALGNTAACN